MAKDKEKPTEVDSTEPEKDDKIDRIEKPPVFTPRLYWAPARDYRITGFPPEIKRAGHIDQREGAIQFGEHVFTARNKEQADFIEGSAKFGKGRDCWRIKDMEEARELTLARDTERQVVRNKPIKTKVQDD